MSSDADHSKATPFYDHLHHPDTEYLSVESDQSDLRTSFSLATDWLRTTCKAMGVNLLLTSIYSYSYHITHRTVVKDIWFIGHGSGYVICQSSARPIRALLVPSLFPLSFPLSLISRLEFSRLYLRMNRVNLST